MDRHAATLVARWGPLLWREAAHDVVALRVQEIQRFVGNDHSFGITSAYKELPKSVNKERMGRLNVEIGRRGYQQHPLKATWRGEKSKRLYKEWSAVIPNISFSDLLELGRMFDQDAVIYKHPSGALGMYHLDRNQVTLAADSAGDIKVDVKPTTELYSKSRNVSFTFGFAWEQEVPWDGHTPFTKKDVVRMITQGDLQP